MEKTFSQAFAEHIRSSGLSVAQVAEMTKLKADALYKLNKGTNRNMNVNDAIKVASVFGETIEEFMGVSERQTKSELLVMIERLSDRERELLLASIKAIVSDAERGSDLHTEDAESDDADQRPTND